MAPGILPNRVSSLPGASQATFGTLLRPTRCPRSFSERFWTILGGLWDPRTMKNIKSVELSAKNKVFTIFAWSLQKERQKLTKPSPERPQGPQKRPRRRQERSRRAPRAPGRGPGATSERSWKRFWSLPGLIWELFGSPRDFIFKLFPSCPRTLRLQPLCPTNAGSAGPALAFTIYRRISVARILSST